MRIILSGKKFAAKCRKPELRGKLQEHEMGVEQYFL
jgi:hypothetical protein